MVDTRVACCGSFDGNLHEGHLYFFERCREHGTELYVFVVMDEVIIANKNRQPLHPQAERVVNVGAVDGVTLVVALLGTVENQYQQILNARPDVYCFGEDQLHIFDAELERRLITLGTRIERIGRKGSISTTSLYFQRRVT